MSFERVTGANLPPEIGDYLAIVESDQPRACKDQHALAAYVRRVFDTEELYIDLQLLEKYLKQQRYFSFSLFPWQQFQLALWCCTFRADGMPRWKTLFDLMARGAGKDGTISFVSWCMIGPYNPVPRYDVDICATNEEQAKRPVDDVIELLEDPARAAKLNRFFYHTKEVVQGRANRGKLRGRTNNPQGRDGMRSGMVIFNEVHAYTNSANISVFVSGQGKVAQPRVGVFSSNGDVNDGPLDDYIAQAERILYEGEPDRGFLPFLCRLDSKSEIDDPECWSKANPSWAYLPTLRRETEDEYHDWKKNPELNGNFVSKRMGLRAGLQEMKVTDYDKLLRTKRELPELRGWACTVGIDYATLNDWAAINLHFRRGEERFDINHAWICTKGPYIERIQPPWRRWCEQGLCTAIDEQTIRPQLLAEYIADAGKLYRIVKLAADTYRWPLLSEAMQAVGFDANNRELVKLIRPSDIMRIEPVIQHCFDSGLFAWDDNPALRWACNNTKRVPSSRKIGSDTGNFYYAKIEPKARKTDPWMALVASMVVENALCGFQPLSLPPIGAITL